MSPRNNILHLPCACGLALLLAACASDSGSTQRQPRHEHRTAIVPSQALELAAQNDLVDLRTLIPDLVVDLRYATDDNITRRPLYPADFPCLLRPSTAAKIQRAQAILRGKGYGLRIWDAWRPPEVQLMLYEKGGDSGLFLDPKAGWSRHCSGTAVDVSLVDADGREVSMPTHHDEGGEHTSYHYRGRNRTISQNLYRLQTAMVEAGMQILDTEWWHFDDADYMMSPMPIIFGHQLGITLQ